MTRRALVINVECFGEARCYRRHHAGPLHGCPPVSAAGSISREVFSAMRLLILAGKIGGRTESVFQPKRKSVAAPHTLPWHAPIPQRAWSFAARHDFC